MRALIVSSDRFEDSELSEPLQQLHAKGVEVDTELIHVNEWRCSRASE